MLSGLGSHAVASPFESIAAAYIRLFPPMLVKPPLTYKVLPDIASASTDVAVVFGAIALISGSIWAKAAWDVWWNWEARLILTLLIELERRKKRWGIASACIGGGQGIAVLFERAA